MCAIILMCTYVHDHMWCVHDHMWCVCTWHVTCNVYACHICMWHALVIMCACGIWHVTCVHVKYDVCVHVTCMQHNVTQHGEMSTHCLVHISAYFLWWLTHSGHLQWQVSMINTSPSSSHNSNSQHHPVVPWTLGLSRLEQTHWDWKTGAAVLLLTQHCEPHTNTNTHTLRNKVTACSYWEILVLSSVQQLVYCILWKYAFEFQGHPVPIEFLVTKIKFTAQYTSKMYTI